MNTPVCPVGYDCTFTKIEPKHYYDHWWNGPYGIAVAIIALIALTIIMCTLFYYWHEGAEARRRDKKEKEAAIRQAEQWQLERTHRVEMQEQFTMQLDTAKGNPETVRLIQEMQRGQK